MLHNNPEGTINNDNANEIDVVIARMKERERIFKQEQYNDSKILTSILKNHSEYMGKLINSGLMSTNEYKKLKYVASIKGIENINTLTWEELKILAEYKSNHNIDLYEKRFTKIETFNDLKTYVIWKILCDYKIDCKIEYIKSYVEKGLEPASVISNIKEIESSHNKTMTLKKLIFKGVSKKRKAKNDDGFVTDWAQSLLKVDKILSDLAKTNEAGELDDNAYIGIESADEAVLHDIKFNANKVFNNKLYIGHTDTPTNEYPFGCKYNSDTEETEKAIEEILNKKSTDGVGE